MTFKVDWTQHAVGHGGFHTGRAYFDGAGGFNWIFDCGARKYAVLDAYLKTWTKHNCQPIDWLFISHFDTDHVSGLDTLMSRVVVRDVMVPYVNEHELAFQLLYEINRGNLSRAFFELVADPAAFFLARGAQRVTFVGRGESDRDEGPPAEAPSRPPRETGWSCKVKPAPQVLKGPSLPKAMTARSGSIQVIDGAGEITIFHQAAVLKFVPYRAWIDPAAHAGLIAELQKLVGPIPWLKGRPGLGDLAFAVGHYARTAAGRAALRKAFKTHAKSPNRSSLSLLSIPVVDQEDGPKWRIWGPRRSRHGEGAPGWLNTGDAEVLDPTDLAGWSANYKSDLGNVQVLALPHHGSDKNSDDAFQKLCPQALLTAHVKADSSKHPGLDVSSFAGTRLACVTNQAETAVRMHFYTRWLGVRDTPF